MRLAYVLGKLDQSVQELSSTRGEPRERLYAAYLKLRTILPETLPEGPVRKALAAIRDRFTKEDSQAPHEESVAVVLCGLDDAAVAALGEDIRALREEVGRAMEAAPPPAPSRRRDAPAHGGGAFRNAAPRPRRILVLFGTNDGHTRALSEFVKETLADAGHEVRLAHVSEADPQCEPSAFDLVLLAGSLHFGRYQNALIDFASQHHAALNAMPSAFLSVSLAAADAYSGARAELDRALSGLSEESQWTPSAVHHAAGAIRHLSFDYYRQLACIMLMERRGDRQPVALDYDMTDYPALAKFALGFAAARAGC